MPRQYEDVHKNPDSDCYVLQVTTLNFIFIPVVMGMTLTLVSTTCFLASVDNYFTGQRAGLMTSNIFKIKIVQRPFFLSEHSYVLPKCTED